MVSIKLISNRVFTEVDNRVPNRLMISSASKDPVAFPTTDGSRCAEETALDARAVTWK